MINNVILVMHYLFVADIPKKPKKGTDGKVEEASFSAELMRPVTMCGNLAMLFYFVSFKVM